MMTPTLVRNRLYFGVDAMRLRESTDRVLARVVGVPRAQATIALSALAEDFRLDWSASRALAAQMVERGLLEKLSPSGMEYGITDGFRALATARLIAPLPRTDAQLILARIARSAAEFNRAALANRYEIDAIAVHGSYMSLEPDLPDLDVAVTGRHRLASARPASGRGTEQTQGTAEIRAMLELHSSYVRIGFFKQLSDVPRPFSVVFRDEGSERERARSR
jgi:hypothetical protein